MKISEQERPNVITMNNKSKKKKKLVSGFIKKLYTILEVDV